MAHIGTISFFVAILCMMLTYFQEVNKSTMGDLSREDTGSSLTLKKTGRKKSRVSFVGDTQEKDKPPTRLDIMKSELERMRKRDEEEERRKKEYKENEIRKVRAQIEQERKDKGLQLYPNSRMNKISVQQKLEKETKAAMQRERSEQAAETARMKNEISMKHGLHVKKKSHSLVKLVTEFMTPDKSSSGLPAKIVREMTLDEILDLKAVYDMFDVGGFGFIRRKDAKSLATILGFRGTKQTFNDMLDEICQDSGKVSFVNFCDFMIKFQEGGDPFDDCQQCFTLMDTEDKGYLNFDDIRKAADDVGLPLSNRMIMEMLDDVDTSGNAEVDREEFLNVMLRTGAFNV